MFAQAPEDALHRRALRLSRQRPGAHGRSCSTRCRTSIRRWRRSSPSSAASRAPRTSSSSSTRTACCSARTATSPTSTRTTGATFETADEYFDYYRDYHAFWKLYGMDLPDAVLKKLYYKNALALVPGLPSGGFPRLIWLDTSSPAAPDSSGRISSKSWCGAATACASPISSSPASASNLDAPAGRASFVEGDLADLDVRRARRSPACDYVLHQAAHSVGAALGEGSDHLEPRQRRRAR